MELSISSIRDYLKGDISPVQTVDAFVKVMSPIHETYQKQWYLNISNYIGNQYLALDPQGTFRVPRAPSWRVRLVINKILPIARTLIAKMREQEPRMYASAMSNEVADIDAAKIATKVAQSIYYGNDFQDSIDEIVSWQVLCGNAYVFSLYNEKAGKEIEEVEKDEGGNIILGPDGEPVKRKFKTGDILLDVASPFEVIPDFSTTSWREQTAMVRRKVRSIDYIKRRYGVDVKPEGINNEYIFEMKIMNMASLSGRNTDINQAIRDSAIVKEMWVMPTDKFPDGRHIIAAAGVELYSGNMDSKLHGMPAIPFSHYGGIKIPGRLLDMAPVENLLQLQWHYNRGRSQIIEQINTLGKAKVFSPIGSVAPGAYTDEPGEMVEYDPNAGPAPVPMPAPGIPNFHLDNLNRIAQEMEDVGGVHEISMGRLPRRATSGIAINILDEKDSSVIAPMRYSLARGLERTFSLAIGIAGDRFEEERVSKIVGKTNEARTFAWRGADLKGQDDIRVMMDQPFPSSRASKLEFAIELVKNGIIPKEAAAQILNVQDLSQVAELSEYNVDSNYARFENMDMMKGIVRPAGKYEMHDVHAMEHRRLLLDPKIDPRIKQLVEAHIEEHAAFASPAQSPTQALTPTGPGATLPAGEPPLQ